MISIGLAVCPTPSAAVMTSEPHGLKGWEWGRSPGKKLQYRRRNAGEAGGTPLSVSTGDPSVQPQCRLHQWGAVWGGESGQVGWQQCVRGLVFHDKALRLFLGGSGEICNQESDRVRFFQKDNP